MLTLYNKEAIPRQGPQQKCIQINLIIYVTYGYKQLCSSSHLHIIVQFILHTILCENYNSHSERVLQCLLLMRNILSYLIFPRRKVNAYSWRFNSLTLSFLRTEHVTLKILDSCYKQWYYTETIKIKTCPTE
jgi:hypothetical protein